MDSLRLDKSDMKLASCASEQQHKRMKLWLQEMCVCGYMYCYNNTRVMCPE